MRTETLDATAQKRPYELPRQKYALWFDVGVNFGRVAQSAVSVALCNNTNTVTVTDDVRPFIAGIRSLAKKREVMIFFD